MDDAELEALRYPIGRFDAKQALTTDERAVLFDELTDLPGRVRQAVAGLSEEQLDTPYRPDGWTVRQVVHHLPDSHLNGYVRFKWAATEDDPLIRTYDQAGWSELEDARSAPLGHSLALLEAVHGRWVGWLRTLGQADWARTYEHPKWGSVTLDMTLQLYGWHGNHHLAHITGLKARMGWTA